MLILSRKSRGKHPLALNKRAGLLSSVARPILRTNRVSVVMITVLNQFSPKVGVFSMVSEEVYSHSFSMTDQVM